jgi:glycosyltransferase involved in cell wall biosynthesis
VEKARPLVSIIVRTKDRLKLLERALRSIATQSYRPIEVVLVNDGGCELPDKDLRQKLGDVSLNYIRLLENKGRAHAGNAGIENAKGDFIGFLDDDDELYPEHVEILASYLGNNKVKVAYTDSLMIHQKYDPQTQEFQSVKKELIYSQDFDYSMLIFENYIPFMCLMFDREVLVNTGGLDTAFEVYEDYDLLIRLGIEYPFHHIKQTTAHYNLWDNTSQIAQMNNNESFQKKSYLQLFSKHSDKFTPERIYQYRARKYSAITGRDDRIAGLRADLGTMENQITEKMKNLRDVIKGKDQYIASLASLIENVKSQLEEHEKTLSTIYTSNGWKFLLFLYRIRERIFPPDSFRRSTFDSFLNLPGSLYQKFSKKKTAAPDGEFCCTIETDLSKPLIIGEGNALYLRGWCFHSTKRIKRLYAIVDNDKHRIFNHSFIREDISREQAGEPVPYRHSLNSGFWGVIPFHSISVRKEVSLRIRAELSGGEVCTSSPDILNLEPDIEKNTDAFVVPVKSFKEPLIAICMTTYNPSIEHFRRQCESIAHQTHSNWICIINDDCSRPELFERMKEVIVSDNRFRIYRNTSNLGFYYNFEKCLTYVPDEAAFIALADQDDHWHEDKLAVLIETFDEKTMLVYSDMNIVDHEGKVLHSTYWTTRENNFTELDLLMIANTVTGASSMVRRELLEWLLPFPDKIGDSYHDQFIACMALAMGKIQYVNRALYNYYQHEGNVLGHYVRKNGDVESRFPAPRISLWNRFFKRKMIERMKDFFLHYRAVYYNHYPRRVLMAHVLNQRCRYVTGKKSSEIQRFISMERFSFRLLPLVLKSVLFRKARISLGVESLLFKSAIMVKLENALCRFTGRCTG